MFWPILVIAIILFLIWLLTKDNNGPSDGFFNSGNGYGGI